MSKILFMSDLHIRKGDPILLNDINDRLNEIIEMIYGIDDVVHLVILGDIFDKNDPRYTDENLIFYGFLSKALAVCGTVSILGGNHGVTNLEQSALGTIEKTLHKLLPDNTLAKIKIADYTNNPMIITEIDGVRICMISHLPKVYLKENNCDFYIEGIKNLVQDMEFDIFCSHFPVVGVQLGDYQLAHASVDPDDLRNIIKANGIILGDIHQGQTLDGNIPIIYPGSIERMTFGECNDEKMVLILDTENKDIRNIGFKSLNARPRFTGEYAADELNKLLADIADLDKSRLRLKIRINLKSGQSVERVLSEFRKALSEIFEVRLDPFVEVERKIKTPEMQEARSDVQLLEAFVRANVDKNKEEVLKIGKEIINDN